MKFEDQTRGFFTYSNENYIFNIDKSSFSNIDVNLNNY